MSRVNPRIVYWLASLHDHEDITDAHHAILNYLVTRILDYGDGTGYCSVETLATRSRHSQRTVGEALRRARKHGLLERTQRGHFTGGEDADKVPSRWKVLYPPLPTGTQPPVGDSPTGKSAHANRQIPARQLARRAPQPEERVSGSEDTTTNHGGSGGGGDRRSEIEQLREFAPRLTEAHMRDLLEALASSPSVTTPKGLIRHRCKQWQMARDGTDAGDINAVRDLLVEHLGVLALETCPECGGEHGGHTTWGCRGTPAYIWGEPWSAERHIIEGENWDVPRAVAPRD